MVRAAPPAATVAPVPVPARLVAVNVVWADTSNVPPLTVRFPATRPGGGGGGDLRRGGPVDGAAVARRVPGPGGGRGGGERAGVARHPAGDRGQGRGVQNAAVER